ncbi:MAG: DUF4178 domain-containing protein [Patescibacteria group bacterium]
MEIEKFRKTIKPGSKLIVEDKEFTVLEVIKYRFDDGGFYIKCSLSDDYVIAEDKEMNVYIIVKPVNANFTEPFPKKLKFDNKDFKFLYFAHTIAEEVWGEGRAKQGSGERFWDYMADDGSYLSLGISDESNEKVDFYGKTLIPGEVNLK